MNEPIWWIRLQIDESNTELIYKSASSLGIQLDAGSDGLYFSNNRFSMCYTIDEISDCLEDVWNQAEMTIEELKGYIMLVDNELPQIDYDYVEHQYNGQVTVIPPPHSTVIHVKTNIEAYKVIDGQEIPESNQVKNISDDHLSRDILRLLAKPDYINFYKILEALEIRFGGEKRLVNTGLISSAKLKQLKQNLNNPQLSGDYARHYKFHGDASENRKLSKGELTREIRKLVMAFLRDKPSNDSE